MKLPRVPLTVLLLWGSALPLSAGLASQVKLAADKPARTYTDPETGIVFPPQIGPYQRESLAIDLPVKGEIWAKYLGKDRSEELGGREMLFNLKTDVRIIPAAPSQAKALLDIYIHAVQKDRTYKLAAYQGKTVFGTEHPLCAGGSLAMPPGNPPVTIEILIFPRGHYLLGFCFMFSATRQAKWQGEIDSFVQQVLSSASPRS